MQNGDSHEAVLYQEDGHMAAIALGTAIVAGSDVETRDYLAGVAIVAGAVVYADSADNNRLKLGATTSLTTSAVVGVALNGAGVNQPVKVCSKGTLTGTATLVVGEPYFVSATAGSVQPSADIGAGQFSAFAGFARGTTTFYVNVVAAKIAHA